MSTKIHNGYIAYHSIEDLLKLFIEVTPLFKENKKTKFFKALVDVYVNEHDKKFLSEMQLVTPEEHFDNLFKLFLKYSEKLRNNEKDIYGFDFSASVIVIPMGENKTLMLFYSERMTDIWDDLKFVNDYHYQNQSDKPEMISEKDWKTREKDWDVALGGDGYGIPSECGYKYTFTYPDAPVRFIELESINSFVSEDKAKRTLTAMHDIFIETEMKNLVLKNNGKTLGADYFKARDLWFEYKKTEEFQYEFNRSLSKLPTIEFKYKSK